MTENTSTAVIGGGISGLYSALCALDSGQSNITVYVASKRRGGRIISQKMGDQTLNMGAEFIDADDEHLVGLCKRLGLQLTPCTDQKTVAFQNKNGQIQQDFLPRYAPISAQVIRDREAMEKDPAYAEALKNMSMADYLAQLQDKVELNPNRGILRKLGDMVTFHSNHVSSDIIETAARSYTSEVGQPPENITAAQFIAETSPSVNKFLGSDCGYRVVGGTEAIIQALHQYLAERGVQFRMGEKLESASRNDDGSLNLTFRNKEGSHSVQAGDGVIGLPTYALSGVSGLEAFGLPSDYQKQLANVQYTHSVKFTVALQPGVEMPNMNMFSPDMQSWSPAPGYITFLCYKPDGVSAKELVNRNLATYAKAFGKKTGDIFNTSPGNIAYIDPGKVPCYSTPSPKNAAASEQLFAQMKAMANQGLGVAGTYMPLDGSVGFMECGADAAKQVSDVLANRRQAGLGREQDLGQDVSTEQVQAPDSGMSFVEKLGFGRKRGAALTV